MAMELIEGEWMVIGDRRHPGSATGVLTSRVVRAGGIGMAGVGEC